MSVRHKLSSVCQQRQEIRTYVSIKNMEKITRKIIFSLFFLYGSFWLLGCQHSAQPVSPYSKAYKDSVLLNEALWYLGNRQFDSAFWALEKCERIAPDYPQIPFVKGAMLYCDGQEEAAVPEIRRSLHIYDSLLQVRPLYQDALNRTICILYLYGRDAYERSIDTLLQDPQYADTARLYEVVLFKKVTFPEIAESAVYAHCLLKDSTVTDCPGWQLTQFTDDPQVENEEADVRSLRLQVFHGSEYSVFPQWPEGFAASLKKQLSTCPGAGKDSYVCEFWLNEKGEIHYFRVLDSQRSAFEQALVKAFAALQPLIPAKKQNQNASCYCRVQLDMNTL